MFGRVPGTHPNISESNSEISTRVPFFVSQTLLEARLVGVVGSNSSQSMGAFGVNAANLGNNPLGARMPNNNQGGLVF